jgi:HD-GYP domain-containing protein (c-di-GMP phosphodiesterase class II)
MASRMDYRDPIGGIPIRSDRRPDPFVMEPVLSSPSVCGRFWQETPGDAARAYDRRAEEGRADDRMRQDPTRIGLSPLTIGIYGAMRVLSLMLSVDIPHMEPGGTSAVRRSARPDRKQEAMPLNLRNSTHFASIVNAIPSTDPQTGLHLHRATCLAHVVLDVVGLPSGDPGRAQVLLAARFQSIGKLAIPDEILDKPGRLSEQDWQRLRQHPRFAADLLQQVPSLAPAAEVVIARYERWDGAGYPAGLRGEAIPWSARALAIAGSIDAMSMDRPYRAAMAASEVVAELDRDRGRQFDPVLVEQVLHEATGLVDVLENGCSHGERPPQVTIPQTKTPGTHFAT